MSGNLALDNETTCPRCGLSNAVLTDKPGLDRALAEYYSKNGFGLIEVCMCCDLRQLSLFWGNALKKAKSRTKNKAFIVCPDCAFWQVTE